MEFAVQKVAHFFDGHVHDETDVSNAETGDVRDLLVGAVVHEFEANDLALVGAQLFDQFPYSCVQFVGISTFGGVEFEGRRGIDGVFVAPVHAVVLAEDIEGAVAANGEEPGFEAVADFGGVGEVKFEEGILDDIARFFDIPGEDAGGVGDEGGFILVEGPPHQEGSFVLGWRGGHVSTVQDFNVRGKDLLEAGLRSFRFWGLRSQVGGFRSFQVGVRSLVKGGLFLKKW